MPRTLKFFFGYLSATTLVAYSTFPGSLSGLVLFSCLVLGCALFLVATSFHLGSLLGAFLVGLPLLELTLGPITIVRRQGRLQFEVNRHWRFFPGRLALSPGTPGRLRLRYAVVASTGLGLVFFVGGFSWWLLSTLGYAAVSRLDTLRGEYSRLALLIAISLRLVSFSSFGLLVVAALIRDPVLSPIARVVALLRAGHGGERLATDLAMGNAVSTSQRPATAVSPVSKTAEHPATDSGVASPTVGKALPWLLVVLLFSLYAFTLLPGVGYFHDTIEFQFVGSELGVPHPTGYPTYVLLNYLFVHLLPIGHVAYRANLLSAVLGVMACLVLYRILRTLNTTAFIAFLMALTFGLLNPVWQQSVVAEVYTLHLLFVTGVFLALIRWRVTGLDRWLMVACALYALSFGNHLTAVTLLPGFVYSVWMVNRRVLGDAWKILMVLGFIVIGASQYGYILWRSIDPSTTYKWFAFFSTHDVRDLPSLLAYVTGSHFKELIFSNSVRDLIYDRLPRMLERVISDVSLLLPLAVVGMLGMKDKSLRAFFLITLACTATWVVFYDVFDRVFHGLPNYLILVVFAARALDATWRGILRLEHDQELHTAGMYVADPTPLRLGIRAWIDSIGPRRFVQATRILFAVGVLLLPVTLLVLNYGKVNQRQNNGVQRQCEAILAVTSPDKTILVDSPEMLLALHYFRLVELKMKNPRLRLEYDIAVETAQGALRDPELQLVVISPDNYRRLRDAGIPMKSVTTGVWLVSSS